jgi:hypothetical protein
LAAVLGVALLLIASTGAVAGPAADGTRQAATLQRAAQRDPEFPLAGAQLEPLWRAIYYREFERIHDSIATRRHVAGFALGIADICERWEVSIRSVAFDAGLETYMAPLRAQVPGRLLQAVPAVGRRLSDASGQARAGADERSAAGWMEQGLRVFQAARRDVRNAWALGSTVGRDAGQQWFNNALSCRAPPGLRMIAALKEYFQAMQHQSPLEDGGTKRSAVLPNRQAR